MKIKTKIYFTFLLLSMCFSNILQAQKSKSSTDYKVAVGLSIHSILDEGYAPMTFNSVTPNIKASLIKDKEKSYFEAGFDFGYGSTNYNDYALFKTDLIDVDLFALYAVKNQINDKLNFKIGGMLDYRILFLLNFPPEFEVGNASYTAAISLGLYAGLDYQWTDKDKLSLNFSNPLLSNVVRPPYTGYDQATTIKTDYGNNLVPLIFHDPQWTHGFKFFRPKLQVGWEHELSSKLSLTTDLSTEYLNYNHINPIKAFKTNLTVGLKF